MITIVTQKNSCTTCHRLPGLVHEIPPALRNMVRLPRRDFGRTCFSCRVLKRAADLKKRAEVYATVPDHPRSVTIMDRHWLQISRDEADWHFIRRQQLLLRTDDAEIGTRHEVFHYDNEGRPRALNTNGEPGCKLQRCRQIHLIEPDFWPCCLVGNDCGCASEDALDYWRAQDFVNLACKYRLDRRSRKRLYKKPFQFSFPFSVL